MAAILPRRSRRRVRWKAYLYVLPAFAFFAIFLGVPLLQTAQYSFYDWNGIGPSTWAGVQNYVDLILDQKLRDSFVHAGILIFFFAAVPVVLALALTAIISRGARMRGMSIFRTLLFLPQVIASVVVATTWVAIYSPNGLVNQLLRAVGLDSITTAWLGGFATALPAVGLIGSWLGIGLCLVLFLSGVANIQPELFESARLEGAGPVREFLSITLPALRGPIAVALTLTVVAALKTFDLVYITTHGGPGNATSVPAYEAYNRAFNTGQVGSAGAVAVVLTLLILIITVFIQKLQPKDVE
ncbi:sugar ABC transporter permease [Paenarthrobacter sp. Z7-10]|uniref:carbohydrate ABC transporter permease n=1 Tax=Paenarthrobacter sp. Z7-10 TaxID=2787635 RepID=UPI0022A93BAB|nr:sugar ABC transporter permease [Paenarthrobacter sp. Z7-10]MCZ2404691.1 sugar ABC transporter permease [Paenarthrobacter sp. Z7-10]